MLMVVTPEDITQSNSEPEKKSTDSSLGCSISSDDSSSISSSSDETGSSIDSASTDASPKPDDSTPASSDTDNEETSSMDSIISDNNHEKMGVLAVPGASNLNENVKNMLKTLYNQHMISDPSMAKIVESYLISEGSL